ncbi:MAG: hypothetical protein V7638_5088 [Acidobacteriota bacterium]|jgi:hypothetical protein
MKRLFAIMVLVIAATVQPALSQCKVGVQASPVGFWTWAPGSQIQVYVLDRDFDDSELPFLLIPLKTWNAVSDTTGSKVKFEYKGRTASPLHCENCLTISRGPVFDKSKRHLTELRTYSGARNRIMTWAGIVIDPRLTNRQTLTNAVAHELGHSFGLLDCYSCKESSTVMIQFKDVNVSNQMDGPSGCDVAQVKAVYQEVAVALRRTLPRKPIVIDEGEEPVEDDTPVVIPKP